MSMRRWIHVAAACLALLLGACEDSDHCTCPPGKVDPPMSDLSVTWERGNIFASLMPIVPPDPIVCRAWLILENENEREAFSELAVPTADVILARNDSTLGVIPIETDWNGILASGQRDTIVFFKNTGPVPIFTPPCGQRVLVDFMIQNADGEARIFRSDTLTFECAF